MKKIILGVLVLFLFSCSGEKLTTDEKVQQIKDGTNYISNETETVCGTIYFAIDEEEQDVRIASVEYYMGDGGSDVTFYYWDNELIYCEYYSFYDGPMENENGTWTPGGEAVGNTYTIYYKNGKMEKFLKEDVETSDFEYIDPDYLYEMSKKIVLLVGDTESEILCDGI
ncbi:MAG: hypothetical protein JXL97_02935 [Bacteroidales bacterium]|nr:hypothetical protein [Bacteroidales bacterium]